MWNLDLSVLIALGATACAYAWGVRNVWRHAGAGHGITVRRVLCFLGAMLALVAALVSPLDGLSDDLFAAHMSQHLLLILVAAPLLVLSDFPLALVWALPRRLAQTLAQRVKQSRTLTGGWRVLSHPVAAWLLFAAALWGWHASVLYEAALANPALHAFEHLVLVAAAMLFWWVLFKPNAPAHIHYAMAIAYLFLTALQSGVLGALMTFTSRPWYAYYATRTAAYGLTWMEDQQLAGIIMWVPGGIVFSLLTIGYFAAWFRALERRSSEQKPVF